MAGVIKPASKFSKLTDGATIGVEGDPFVIQVLRIRIAVSGKSWDNTNDTDTANTKAIEPWQFWDKRFTISGLLVSGSPIGLGSLGATDAGVPVTMTFEKNHTLAGNLLVEAVYTDWKRKAKTIPIVFTATGVGAWTEAKT